MSFKFFPVRKCSESIFDFSDNILTFDIIEKYPEKNWDWIEISRNDFKTEYENELTRLTAEAQAGFDNYDAGDN